MERVEYPIRRHELAYNKTLSYFIDHIQCGKSLSKQLIKEIRFENGDFFTILPNNIDIERLYLFKYGGILTRSQELRTFFVEGYGEIRGYDLPNTDQILARFIFDFLERDKNYCAVYSQAIAEKTDPCIVKKPQGEVFFNNEVYYLSTSVNSIDQISTNIKLSGEVWHFLCVLTQGAPNASKELTQIDFDNICQNIKYIIVGAYDGEGYLFWEKREAP